MNTKTTSCVLLALLILGCTQEHEGDRKPDSVEEAERQESSDAVYSPSDPMFEKIRRLTAVSEMMTTLETLTEGKGEKIHFGWLVRKPAGRDFRSAAYWATTMWPENASDYHAYMLGFITEHGSVPWQILLVAPETEEVLLIRNRRTGELISLDQWLHLNERTSLYTAEEAFAERYDHFEKEQRDG